MNNRSKSYQRLVGILCFIFLPTNMVSQTINNDDKLIKDKKNHIDFNNCFTKKSEWNKPFWADMHSTITRVEVSYASSRSEYNYGNISGMHRPFVFSNLGIDIPIWMSEHQNNKYGLSLSIPFFIDVWMDYFERSTAAVINTSYRFGLPEIGFINRINSKYIKNYSVKLSPLKHECTHIGDELTIKRKDWELPITRVNVSYNYFEFQFTLNDADNSQFKNSSYRAGILLLQNPKDEWYNATNDEADLTKIKKTTSSTELYFQYQYQTKVSKKFLQGIASCEFRKRPIYNYPNYIDKNNGLSEYNGGNRREWSYNFFVGIRYNNPNNLGLFSKIGLGLRFYRGLNPHGQFRSFENYEQFGLSLIFE